MRVEQVLPAAGYRIDDVLREANYVLELGLLLLDYLVQELDLVARLVVRVLLLVLPDLSLQDEDLLVLLLHKLDHKLQMPSPKLEALRQDSAYLYYSTGSLH